MLQALEEAYLPTLVAGADPRAEVASALSRQVQDVLSHLFDTLTQRKVNAADLRLRTLDECRPIAGWQAQDLHRTCFLCLTETPQHVFACGHQICDSCVLRMGRSLHDAEYHFQVRCILCQNVPSIDVYLKPPTAGVRVISLDGGGVSGRVELEILDRLQQRLGGDCDIRVCFDLAVGTSAGEQPALLDRVSMNVNSLIQEV